MRYYECVRVCLTKQRSPEVTTMTRTPEEIANSSFVTNFWTEERWDSWVNLKRKKVPGGWILHSSTSHDIRHGRAISESMVFVPDPEHTWDWSER